MQDLCILGSIWILFIVFLPSNLPAFSAILFDLLLVVVFSGSAILDLQSDVENVNKNNNVCPTKTKNTGQIFSFELKIWKRKKIGVLH